MPIFASRSKRSATWCGSANASSSACGLKFKHLCLFFLGLLLGDAKLRAERRRALTNRPAVHGIWVGVGGVEMYVEDSSSGDGKMETKKIVAL